MLTKVFIALVALSFAAPAAAETETERAVTSLYERFVAAQNARDTKAVRALMWDSPSFVWISDGKAFWGADRMIERMSAFQRSDVWEVKPDRERARVVEVSPVSAVLFQPLKLTLGSRADPQRIAFLVNVLCVRTPDGWRVGALYTTEENPN
jgi:hypothetical protein